VTPHHEIYLSCGFRVPKYTCARSTSIDPESRLLQHSFPLFPYIPNHQHPSWLSQEKKNSQESFRLLQKTKLIFFTQFPRAPANNHLHSPHNYLQYGATSRCFLTLPKQSFNTCAFTNKHRNKKRSAFRWWFKGACWKSDVLKMTAGQPAQANLVVREARGSCMLAREIKSKWFVVRAHERPQIGLPLATPRSWLRRRCRCKEGYFWRANMRSSCLQGRGHFLVLHRK